MSEDVKSLEDFGRQKLEARAAACEAQAKRHEEAAPDCNPEGRAYRQHMDSARMLRGRAEELRRRVQDSTRYLWSICLGEDCGTFYVVGTACYAEGRRAAKSLWEGVTANMEKLREAFPGEADGEWEGDASTTLVSPEVGAVAVAKTDAYGRGGDVTEGQRYRVSAVTGKDGGTLVQLAETGDALWSARRFYYLPTAAQAQDASLTSAAL